MARKILSPSELFEHDTSCHCFNNFISELPSTTCSECSKLRTKLTNDSPDFFFKDIWCPTHSIDYCAVCQSVKPSHEDRAFDAPEGYCINCWDSHKYGRSVPYLSEHLHHHYCSNQHSFCNYSKDSYCPYYHSAIRYSCNKDMIDGITGKCYRAVKKRLDAIK